ncbi:hypothetical protein [Paraburkholderia sp. MM6662-R1]|uniref:hypothetical protein n=1 Tax=Paraburkholderia sp. MM6662-R1 TaxID=2991066 RepID=UPI003D1B75E6
MTDRFHSLTVVLDQDLREDDARALMAAIQQLRFVLDVSGNVSDLAAYVAEERARHEIGQRLWRALYPDRETH